MKKEKSKRLLIQLFKTVPFIFCLFYKYYHFPYISDSRRFFREIIYTQEHSPKFPKFQTAIFTDHPDLLSPSLSLTICIHFQFVLFFKNFIFENPSESPEPNVEFWVSIADNRVEVGLVVIWVLGSVWMQMRWTPKSSKSSTLFLPSLSKEGRGRRVFSWQSASTKSGKEVM